MYKSTAVFFDNPSINHFLSTPFLFLSKQIAISSPVFCLLKYYNLIGMWLLSSIGLSTEAGGSRVLSLEVAGKEWVESVAEEDLGTAELWEGEPEDEGELEEVVEWEPVGEVETGFKDAKEFKRGG